MDAASALRCLACWLCCISLGGACVDHIKSAPSQAAGIRLGDAHSTIVPDASSAEFQLNDASVSGLQSIGQKTNHVHSSSSSNPTWSKREIRHDVHGSSTGGIVRHGGTEVCDALRSCLLPGLLSQPGEHWPRPLAQGASGATTCGEKGWTSLRSTYVVTFHMDFLDSGACLPRFIARPLSPPTRHRARARSGALVGRRLPALPRPRRPRGHGESALSPIAPPDACSPSRPRVTVRSSHHGSS